MVLLKQSCCPGGSFVADWVGRKAFSSSRFRQDRQYLPQQRIRRIAAPVGHAYKAVLQIPSARAVREWDAAQPSRTTENLIRNPGAEITVDQPIIPFWQVTAGTPAVFFYDDSQPSTNPPAAAGPGPENRGSYLFAGGLGNMLSGLGQTISLAEELAEPVPDAPAPLEKEAV